VREKAVPRLHADKIQQPVIPGGNLEAMLAPSQDPAPECHDDSPGAGSRMNYDVRDVLVVQFPSLGFYMCPVASCDSGPQGFIVQFDSFHSRAPSLMTQ
jgi:hypothetical protein